MASVALRHDKQTVKAEEIRFVIDKDNRLYLHVIDCISVVWDLSYGSARKVWTRAQNTDTRLERAKRVFREFGGKVRHVMASPWYPLTLFFASPRFVSPTAKPTWPFDTFKPVARVIVAINLLNCCNFGTIPCARSALDWTPFPRRSSVTSACNTCPKSPWISVSLLREDSRFPTRGVLA